jgi:hypothetical protein
MGILVSAILRRAATVLNDAAFVRWPKAELIDWINDGAAEIVLRRPSANVVIASTALVAGVNQKIPTDAIELLDIPSNSSGKAVRRIDRQLLDDQYPLWRAAKAGPTKHYAYDDRSSTAFFVYPPAVANAVVELMYSAPPAPVDDDTDTLLLDRAYMGPIVSYVIYRAMAKDSEYADGAMAMTHAQAFAEALGVQNEVAGAVSPNASSV